MIELNGNDYRGNLRNERRGLARGASKISGDKIGAPALEWRRLDECKKICRLQYHVRNAGYPNGNRFATGEAVL